MIKHLACIMDGNRRWAKERGLMPWDGHREGVKAMDRVVDHCLELNIEYLTLYLFSIENFKRSEEEKKFLFTIIAKQAEKYVPKYNAKGVKVKFIGQRDLFPQSVVEMCDRIEKQTAHNTKLILNLLFCYGGQQEILAGVKTCLSKVQAGEMDIEQLDATMFKNCLWSGDVPDPDIMIRTGGASRLSNFLLFQVAYTELRFIKPFWPDMTPELLDEIIEEFNQSKRNFGK
ncbi:di-trans,poly-cis-decaprenylcistransferase [bacterium]|jgi:undecaprenyl diphosphate synthase|nr:di-trans,poly-cis-decaprenylcistransferase [bacterium]MBT5014937.1 di-trans,poly-cis-decaprenylcistransferase [bacterium]